MPPADDYLLTNIGFRKETPIFSLLKEETFFDVEPIGSTLTLRFDTSTRYCTGWRDIQTGERFSCPNAQTVDPKYDQCAACQKRTGFNPAFYHATSVSTQQEARNAEPHILYLAYFGGEMVKVGISHAARGHARLLEQGARHAVILDTFPTAQIARHYEAAIAKLPGVAETVSVRQKLALLTSPIDISLLTATHKRAEAATGVTFTAGEVLHFDHRFFPSGVPDFSHLVITTEQALISGQVTGVLGSILFAAQQGTLLALPLKRFVGYPVHISETESPLDLPQQQMSLF